VTLLDTSALIDFLVDGDKSEAVEQLVSDGRAATSAICAYELVAGVKSPKHRRERETLIDAMEVIPVDTAIAIRAAHLYTDLRSRGITIDNEDLLVGATALELDMSLVTCNLGHFEPIPGVRLEEGKPRQDEAR
jgi:tRNA(fMet)-specific endonuclease VapC